MKESGQAEATKVLRNLENKEVDARCIKMGSSISLRYEMV